uniref:Putative ATPase domain containing protein n=1 Tax=viral metagenome TaxID=1070528 RepID=A0A6M3Y1Y9_9ZZZZ
MTIHRGFKQNNPPKTFLDAKLEAEKLLTMYYDTPRSGSFNFLLLGEIGTGKSFLLNTARKPIHLDCFDPGGTTNLVDMIKKGELIPDIRWEEEDPLTPSVFREWEKVMKERITNGYFNHFGTYCLDSSSTWSDAIMNQVLKSEGLAGQPPRWAHDYVPQKVKIQNWIRLLMRLPCDFILTGHLDGSKDEVTGRMSYRYMTTGKAAITIPLLFDEVYVMDPKTTSSGVEYRILTQSNGTYLARSRMAKDGLLKTHEKPDIKAMLKKCGFPTEDKPLFKTN